MLLRKHSLMRPRRKLNGSPLNDLRKKLHVMRIVVYPRGCWSRDGEWYLTPDTLIFRQNTCILKARVCRKEKITHI